MASDQSLEMHSGSLSHCRRALIIKYQLTRIDVDQTSMFLGWHGLATAEPRRDVIGLQNCSILSPCLMFATAETTLELTTLTTGYSVRSTDCWAGHRPTLNPYLLKHTTCMRLDCLLGALFWMKF